MDDAVQLFARLAEAGKARGALVEGAGDVISPAYNPTQQDVDTVKALARRPGDIGELWESISEQDIALRDVGK